MCGIAGASLNPADAVNAKAIARAMLLAIEHRGKDATGFAFRDSTGAFQVHKDNVAAAEFVKRRLCLPKKATTFIAHTRFATQGSEYYNVNNHPIATGGIVGVHNGYVSNDWELFRDVDNALGCKMTESVRIGEVDSEAIFACLGFLDKAPEEVLSKIRGGAAVAWMNEADVDERLHLARLNSSPLIIGETDTGSLFFASTQEAVEAGANAAGLTIAKIRDIAEGVYVQVLEGQYDVVREFEPARAWYNSSFYTTPSTSTRGITDRMSRTPGWDDDDYEFFAASSHPNMTHEERTYAYIIGKEFDLPSRATVTSLSERLAQEEPETDDSDALDEWLALNAAELELSVEKDDAKDKKVESDRKHKEFEEYVAAPTLNSYYLTNIEYPVPVLDESVYLVSLRHDNREARIETWLGSLKTTEAAKTRSALSLKADVRPGYPVTLDIDGLEAFGHIVEVPETFPHGSYLIRAYVPNKRRQMGFEAIFVARNYFEFEVCQFGTTLESEIPKKGTEIVKAENAVKVLENDGAA